jgi:hypothetical protein
MFSISCAGRHLYQAQGCPDCGKSGFQASRMIDAATWIERATSAHGDRFRYRDSYFQGIKKPVTIYCLEHKKYFTVSSAEQHISRAQGCDECKTESYRRKRSLGGTEWIARARSKHGSRFDYSEVVYSSQKHPVNVICELHRDHGSFSISPYQHVKQKYGGCPHCGPVKDAEEFFLRCRRIHPEFYDFSQAEFTGNKGRVTVYCKKHDYEFTPTANALLSGQGCKYCGFERVAASRSSDRERFIASAKLVHGEVFGYERVVYNDSKSTIEIRCPIHGYFRQSPNTHLNGSGCSTCGKIARAVGIGKAKWRDHPAVGMLPGSLYYLKLTLVDGRVLFKIGVTKSTVDIRFRDYRGRANPLDIDVLASWRAPIAAAISIEQELLREFRQFRARGERVLLSGNSELFTKDVLGITGPEGPKMERRIRRELNKVARSWERQLT